MKQTLYSKDEVNIYIINIYINIYIYTSTKKFRIHFEQLILRGEKEKNPGIFSYLLSSSAVVNYQVNMQGLFQHSSMIFVG